MTPGDKYLILLAKLTELIDGLIYFDCHLDSKYIASRIQSHLDSVAKL